ncbi:MAG: APC family permease [Thermomicrobiales bacterium]|nr:APC family permease [Thermomicrobiales bacterium]
MTDDDESPLSRSRGIGKFRPDLSGKVQSRGKHSGDKYVRIVRPAADEFSQLSPGVLVAAPEDADDRGPVGRAFFNLKRFMIGQALTSASAEHERLSNRKALAVLSSDALSSVAYASEEILRVLLIAGLSALSLSLPIGAGIVCLLLIVGASYRQTIKAYPHGGGSYIVAKDNLGETPALVAGGALLVDYVLTVAVSVSSAVAAMVSAFPSVHNHLVAWGVFFVVLITLLNLRGLRESGTIFAIPTYLFLILVFVMIGIGFVRNAATGFEVHEPRYETTAVTGSVTLFLILRAFSSGCSALTGVEAISDGVPAFQKPEWKNARTTLTWMIGILAIMFAGITFLAHQYGAVPLDQADHGYETVISQIARNVFGGQNAAYYLMQFATMAILVLAANTAYSDFPRLAYFMARDKYMPSQFTFRGDRLAYSFGIITLGVLSCSVLAIFGGETERLIPLYAVGVFTSFTLSQLGMVVRWHHKQEPGWRVSRFLNGLGATATGIVAVVVAVTKFTHGAWIVMVLIPLMVLTFKRIHRHYLYASKELAATTPVRVADIHHVMVVPISGINVISQQTLAYARSITPNVTAVHITDEESEVSAFQKEWEERRSDIPLIIIESPYRSLIGPLVHYIEELRAQHAGAVVTVVLPEYVPSHWWEQVLHNQTALRIKAALLFKPGIVVTSVPYHLAGSQPNRGISSLFMRRL